MSLAKADSKALIQAQKALNKYGGLAIWNDVVTPAVKGDFGNIITPEVRGDFEISILPTKIEDGWISSQIATADNKVFLVSAKQLSDLGLTYDNVEVITYNGDTIKIERDEPYMGGQAIVLHRFICSVTS
jgi:hypothetical protein